MPANKDNTSNLFFHLKTKHVPEYESQRMRSTQMPAQSLNKGGKKKVCPTSQPQSSIVQAFLKSALCDKKSKRVRIDITKAITIHLCKDMVPFQTIEHNEFQDIIKTLDPRYVVKFPNCIANSKRKLKSPPPHDPFHHG